MIRSERSVTLGRRPERIAPIAPTKILKMLGYKDTINTCGPHECRR